MFSMTNSKNQTPTNSDDEDIITLFRDSDEEYEYESEEVEEIKINDVNAPPNDYWRTLGSGNVLNPLPQRTKNRVHVTQSAIPTHSHGQTRVISNWFTNVGSMMGIQRKHTPKKKKSVAYIFRNEKDKMLCDITLNGITDQEQSNFDIQMKLNSVDFVNFSLGSGETFSLSQHFAKWIINDYEPHMWREVGIHIYLMFGNDWSCLPLFKAKAVIEQCLTIWKKIKKDVYIAFCEIVLEREYSDVDPVPDSITTQIDRAMWFDSVKKPYQSGFMAFRGWYESKLLKLFEEKKSLKEMKKEQKDQLFHHMFNFCGLYTMHNRVDGVVNHVPGMA